MFYLRRCQYTIAVVIGPIGPDDFSKQRIYIYMLIYTYAYISKGKYTYTSTLLLPFAINVQQPPCRLTSEVPVIEDGFYRPHAGLGLEGSAEQNPGPNFRLRPHKIKMIKDKKFVAITSPSNNMSPTYIGIVGSPNRIQLCKWQVENQSRPRQRFFWSIP